MIAYGLTILTLLVLAEIYQTRKAYKIRKKRSERGDSLEFI